MTTTYVFNGYTVNILDVDECVTGAHKCDLTASKCLNNPGNYSCQCKDGFFENKNNCRGM